MEIKATEVKKLREKTGAGMMDCKNALVKTEGDFDKAERLLKEQGLAAAVKKSDRVTNSGKIFAKILPVQGHHARAHLRDGFRGAQQHVPGARRSPHGQGRRPEPHGPDGGAPAHGQGDHRQDQGEHAAAAHRHDARRRERGPGGVCPRRPHRGHAPLLLRGYPRRRTFPA